MSTLNVNSIKDADGTDDNLEVFGKNSCKVWCLLDGTGTASVTDSYNVDSISDIGTGSYTVAFTTSFATANYVQQWTAGEADGAGNYYTATIFFAAAAGNCSGQITNQSGAQVDVAHVDLACFGDQ